MNYQCVIILHLKNQYIKDEFLNSIFLKTYFLKIKKIYFTFFPYFYVQITLPTFIYYKRLTNLYSKIVFKLALFEKTVPRNFIIFDFRHHYFHRCIDESFFTKPHDA